MPVAVVASNSSVSVGVLVAVLSAAVLHATWNAIAHAIPDRLAGFALIGAASMIGGAVIVLVAPAPARASWPFLAASVALHGVYNLLLMRCYQGAEFGQIYPLARGTSPWLVAIAAAVFAQETLTPVRLLGVGVISAGLASLVFAGGRPSRAQLPVLAAAVLTGVAVPRSPLSTAWAFTARFAASPLSSLALASEIPPAVDHIAVAAPQL